MPEGEGTDAPYPSRRGPFRMSPLPDEMKGSPNTTTLPTGEVIVTGHKTLRPNSPAPEREPVEDQRPGVILAQAGFKSAEEWGNEILAKRNSGNNKLPGPLDQFSLPPDQRN